MDRIDREAANRNFPTLFPGLLSIVAKFCGEGPGPTEVREKWLPMIEKVVKDKLQEIEEQGNRKLELLESSRLPEQQNLDPGLGRRWDNGVLRTAPVTVDDLFGEGLMSEFDDC